MAGDGALGGLLLDLAVECGGNLLAIDSATTDISLCFVDLQQRSVFETYLSGDARPSEALAATLAKRAHSEHFNYSKLAAIVIGLGPGSFTGLRVGLASAKGLALAGDIPLYGCDSLGTLAIGAGSGHFAVAFDARAGEVFSASYEIDREHNLSAVIPLAARKPKAFIDLMQQQSVAIDGIVGDAVPILQQEHFDIGPQPLKETPPMRAAYSLLSQAQRLRGGQSDSLRRLTPYYLRLSEAEKNFGEAPYSEAPGA